MRHDSDVFELPIVRTYKCQMRISVVYKRGVECILYIYRTRMGRWRGEESSMYKRGEGEDKRARDVLDVLLE